MVAVDNVLLSFTTATLLAVHVVELVRLPVIVLPVFATSPAVRAVGAVVFNVVVAVKSLEPSKLENDPITSPVSVSFLPVAKAPTTPISEVVTP